MMSGVFERLAREKKVHAMTLHLERLAASAGHNVNQKAARLASLLHGFGDAEWLQLAIDAGCPNKDDKPPSDETRRQVRGYFERMAEREGLKADRARKLDHQLDMRSDDVIG